MLGGFKFYPVAANFPEIYTFFNSISKKLHTFIKFNDFINNITCNILFRTKPHHRIKQSNRGMGIC